METQSRQTSLSKEHQEILKRGTATIQQGWLDVQTLLDRSDAENTDAVISEFLDNVDDSHYSLTDWLNALLDFDKWLTAKEIAPRPLASMIGYIHCSTLTSAKTLAPPELSRLVLEMLDQWGFDATQGV